MAEEKTICDLGINTTLSRKLSHFLLDVKIAQTITFLSGRRSIVYAAKKSHFRKGAWTFVCSHGIVMNDMDDSHFYPDSVGKSNVPIHHLKRTKSRGSAVKGNLFLFCI